jgi:hypothetical protein
MLAGISQQHLTRRRRDFVHPQAEVRNTLKVLNSVF